ncbi:HNH endonuclease signature motif containing protein [Streptomyces sp. Q6]|uniref:HNH endonuclease signature motif containing protein n=1 Tax=Streptomyces citrinus TaxID=3118173 RepID=A0ACD5AF53_9ACTN
MISTETRRGYLLADSPWPTAGRNTVRKDLKALAADGFLHGCDRSGRRTYLVDRFWAKVQIGTADECWPWTAAVNPKTRYGQFRVGATIRGAHTIAVVYRHGPVPVGHVVDHLCRTRTCVNPHHLDVVTIAENTRRGMAPTAVAARENRCTNGHEFTPENTIAKGDGHRRCRQCFNASQRARYAAKAVAA